MLWSKRLFVALLLAGAACISRAQVQLPLLDVGKTASASYVGPGDIVSGALGFWSCARSYNAAYATGSNNACLLADTATNTTTFTMKILSTGFADVAGALASSACSVACSVRIAYDQSGNGVDMNLPSCCAGTPSIAFSSLNSLPGMAGTNANNTALESTATITRSTPYTFSAVYKRTGSTNGPIINGDNGSSALPCLSGGTNANEAALTDDSGNNITVTGVTDGSFHAAQGVVNGVSSTLRVDSLTESTGTATGNLSAVPIRFQRSAAGACPANNRGSMDGTVMEVGIWASAFDATQRGNMNSNQHGANGYNF